MKITVEVMVRRITRLQMNLEGRGHGLLKADSHISCRAHAVPLPCRAAKGLECDFPILFTHCGPV